MTKIWYSLCSLMYLIFLYYLILYIQTNLCKLEDFNKTNWSWIIKLCCITESFFISFNYRRHLLDTNFKYTLTTGNPCIKTNHVNQQMTWSLDVNKFTTKLWGTENYHGFWIKTERKIQNFQPCFMLQYN